MEERLRELFMGATDGAHLESSCLVIDRNLKIASRIDRLDHPEALDEITAALKVGGESGRNSPALIPVLHVPNALSAEFCAELVACYRQSSEKTQRHVGYSGSANVCLKRSVNVNIDNTLAEEIDNRIAFSLLPAIESVFDYRVTRRLAYKVICYDADEAGFLADHRNNMDESGLYRRFALSLALNDDWEGEGICFPEYSDEAFKLGVGDAVVLPVSPLHRVGPVVCHEHGTVLT